MMKKYVVVRKIEKVVVVSGSRGLQKTELLQYLQLGARHCHVGQHYAIGVVADSKFGLWAYSWA